MLGIYFLVFQMCPVVPGPDIYLLSYLQQQTGHLLHYHISYSRPTLQFKDLLCMVGVFDFSVIRRENAQFTTLEPGLQRVS